MYNNKEMKLIARERVKSICLMLLVIVPFIKEIHGFLGDRILVWLAIVAVLQAYQVIKMTYLMFVPLRTTRLQKIVPKRIREVCENIQY